MNAETLRNVTMGQKIGSGTFGSVYAGLMPDGRLVAVKVIPLECEPDSEPNSLVEKEVQLHKSLSSPYIVRYLGSLREPPSPHTLPAPSLRVFLEFVSGGSVRGLMKTLPEGRLPFAVLRVYARHLFRALHYLHSRDIAHRDVKPDNVLISAEQGIAKLADFDQARVMGTQGIAQTLAGTPFWMAPEVITEELGYDPGKADIWSAGCTVAEMFSGHPPWRSPPARNTMALVATIARSQGWPNQIDRGALPPVLEGFLEGCLRRDPLKRWTAAECLEHAFLQETE